MLSVGCRNCFEIYEEGLKRLEGEDHLENCRGIWKSYSETLEDLHESLLKTSSAVIEQEQNQDEATPQKRQKRNDGVASDEKNVVKALKLVSRRRFSVLQRSAEKEMIQPKFFRIWVSLLYRDHSWQAVAQALDKFSSSNLYEEDSTLWLFHLSLFAEEPSVEFDDCKKILQKTLSKFQKDPEKQRDAWNIMLNARPENNSVPPSPFSGEPVQKRNPFFLKPQKILWLELMQKDKYLRWVFGKEGLEGARRVYKSLATVPPFSLPFHLSMVSIEEQEWSSYDDRTKKEEETRRKIREIYETSVLHFGHENIDIWLLFSEWESGNSSSNVPGDPFRAPLIFERARRTLPSELSEEFVKEYTLRKIMK